MLGKRRRENIERPWILWSMNIRSFRVLFGFLTYLNRKHRNCVIEWKCAFIGRCENYVNLCIFTDWIPRIRSGGNLIRLSFDLTNFMLVLLYKLKNTWSVNYVTLTVFSCTIP